MDFTGVNLFIEEDEQTLHVSKIKRLPGGGALQGEPPGRFFVVTPHA